MRGRLVGIVVMVVASFVTIATWAPQLMPGEASAAQGPAYVAPRTADGHPDLQGVWRVWNLAQYDVEPHSTSPGVPAGMGVIVDPPDGMIPYKPWALARKKENFAKSRVKYPYNPLDNPDPVAKCYLPGVPRITYLGFPFEIVQTKDYVGIIYEWMHIRRLIPLTNRPLLEGIDLWSGQSRGRWDGNTLVVKVTNLSDYTWLDMAGNFNSKALEVEERYTRIGTDTLNYEVTLTDPNVFTRPWKMRMPIQRQDGRLLEYECHELLEDAGLSLAWERDWDKPLVIPKE